MQRKTRRLITAVAVIGVLAAGGAAFTATNTVNASTNVAGYGVQTVSGAQVDDTHYQLSADGTLIEEVDLHFFTAINGTTNASDGVADVVKIGFDAAGAGSRTLGTACVVANDGTSATCGAPEGSGGALAVANDDAHSGSLAVAVSHP